MDIKKIIAGDKPAIARAISLVENEHSRAIKLLSAISTHTGKAHRIGVTGPPGVGKSTLVNELARAVRQHGKTVGIIAIDPSSIFSGGAILGDRIRMQSIGQDSGVFIRSMATRGSSGGVSRATSEAADILDASGKSYIIIETVGVGQSEVEIFKSVDTTVLVLSPESGDVIQAMKAGIMEIADMIIINKADRPGAQGIMDAVRGAGEISSPKKRIPLLQTEAIKSVGIQEVVKCLEERWEYLNASRELQRGRCRIIKDKVKSLVLFRMEESLRNDKKIDRLINTAVDDILSGKSNAYQVAGKISALLTAKTQRKTKYL